MQQGLFSQGLELMVFGMGTVMLFLALLVFATGLMSRLVRRCFPDRELDPAPSRAASAVSHRPEQDEQLMVVISAAIHRYRSRR